MKPNINAISDNELEKVVGGMSELDLAYLQGTINGHLFNAMEVARKTGNDMLITYITYMVTKNQQKEFAEIVKTVDELTAGVFDSSSSAAYDHIKQAKQVILNSGILKA